MSTLADRVKNSSLRNRLRSARGYVSAKLFLKRISGQELWLKPTAVTALYEDGGWAICTDISFPATPLIYSFGIGDTIDFERTLIEKFNAEVHAFDPTPFVEAWLGDTETPQEFHFYPWALAGRDETLSLYPRRRSDGKSSEEMFTLVPEAGETSNAVTVAAKRLATVMDELGHDEIDILKMDVEGAEYEALHDLLDSKIYPKQILVEFHHRFASIGVEKTRVIIDRLKASGYQIVYISPIGREITFARV